MFMCVCSTFRPSDFFLLFVKNGFVVGVRLLKVTARKPLDGNNFQGDRVNMSTFTMHSFDCSSQYLCNMFYNNKPFSGYSYSEFPLDVTTVL